MLNERDHRLRFIREDLAAADARRAEAREREAAAQRLRDAEITASAFAVRAERLAQRDHLDRLARAEREARVTSWALQPAGLARLR